jgi:hypothetical protein
MVAGKNGQRTQNEVPINPPINRIARTVRTKSRCPAGEGGSPLISELGGGSVAGRDP